MIAKAGSLDGLGKQNTVWTGKKIPPLDLSRIPNVIPNEERRNGNQTPHPLTTRVSIEEQTEQTLPSRERGKRGLERYLTGF